MTEHAALSMNNLVFSDTNDRHHVKSDKRSSEDQAFQPALKNKTLKHHKKQVQYKCDVCGDDFGSLNFLQVHKKIHSSPTHKDPGEIQSTEKNLQIPSNEDLTGGQTSRDEWHKAGKKYVEKSNLKFEEFIDINVFPDQKKIEGKEEDEDDNKSEQKFDYENDLETQMYIDINSLKHHKHQLKIERNKQNHENEIITQEYEVESQHSKHTELKDPFNYIESSQILPENEHEFKCDVCSAIFMDPDILAEHLMKHTTIDKCEICGHQFLDQEDRVSHQQEHSADKLKYKCIICMQSFKDARAFKAHKRVVHEGETEHKCRTCGKTFCRRAVLKLHEQIHSGEKVFKCDICGKEFCRGINLKLHQRIHTGEKPYECEICGKKFADRGVWHRHTQTHTGEKGFHCDICGKNFTRSFSLKKHSKIHTGEKEKDFKCDVCGNQYYRLYDLKQHLRVHTGETPYSCDVCERKFYDPCCLKRHKQVHTGLRPYKCPICGKDFTRKSNIPAHIKTVHKETEPLNSYYNNMDSN